MGLSENLERIQNFRRFGQECGRNVMVDVLEKLDHPEKNLKVIHVAGTNGKGSVCSFMEKILRNAGYRTGLFTSPHLIRFNERIRVDGEMIPDDALLRITDELFGMEFSKELTMFDYCLAIALIWFKECGCDYVILETGLGGRLDSTNAIVNKELCVITKIGFDHMQILGDTLSEIALEKAGILKSGVPAVVGFQENEAFDAVYDYCLDNDIEADFLGIVTDGVCRREVSFFESPEDSQSELDYRQQNIALAKEAITALFPEMTEGEIQKGIDGAYWPGRLEVVSKEPFILVDAAHNTDGVKALKQYLKKEYPNERFMFVTGMLKDKDVSGMLSDIQELAHEFVTATVSDARAMKAVDIAKQLRVVGFRRYITACENADAAIKTAMSRAWSKIVVFGSIYFIAEILDVLHYDINGRKADN